MCRELNMLNVAFTRTKQEFQIIGDFDLLKEHDKYKVILDK